jgi:hypothetical protein
LHPRFEGLKKEGIEKGVNREESEALGIKLKDIKDVH